MCRPPPDSDCAYRQMRVAATCFPSAFRWYRSPFGLPAPAAKNSTRIHCHLLRIQNLDPIPPNPAAAVEAAASSGSFLAPTLAAPHRRLSPPSAAPPVDQNLVSPVLDVYPAIVPTPFAPQQVDPNPRLPR